MKIVINIPDNVIPRVRQAFVESYARVEGDNDLQHFQRCIRNHVREVVIGYERRQAAEAAGIQAATAAESEITIS